MKIEVDNDDLFLIWYSYGEMINYGYSQIKNICDGGNAYFEVADNEKTVKIEKVIKKINKLEEKRKDINALREIADAEKSGKFPHKENFFDT